VPLLTRFYRQLVEMHSVDAIVLADGGSDSIMAGDEEGLGDPIEDAVPVTTVASLEELKAKVLITIGLSTDRFNHVSDGVLEASHLSSRSPPAGLRDRIGKRG
jgi:hypothetical protein